MCYWYSGAHPATSTRHPGSKLCSSKNVLAMTNQLLIWFLDIFPRTACLIVFSFKRLVINIWCTYPNAITQYALAIKIRVMQNNIPRRAIFFFSITFRNPSGHIHIHAFCWDRSFLVSTIVPFFKIPWFLSTLFADAQWPYKNVMYLDASSVMAPWEKKVCLKMHIKTVRLN